MTARWLLVRHGITEWALEGRYAGHTDVVLHDHGRAMGRRLANRLVAEEFTTCYTSDLRRATETLELLLAEHAQRVTVHRCRELRELHFGDWEGRTYAEIAALPGSDRVLAGDEPAPGGESLAELASRVQSFFVRLKRAEDERPDETSLVVAHGGPLRVLVCLLLGLRPTEHWRFEVGHGSLTEVTWDPSSGARLVRLNDQCH